MIKGLFKKTIPDSKTFKSMMINMIIKGVALVLSYVYVPFLLNYLGDEKYGLWATILSIGTWITMCDIGIGGGLRNILTKELTEKQYKKAQASVSTAYIVLSFLSLLLWGLLLFFTIFVGWGGVFNTKVDIDLPVFISFSFICVNFVLSLVNIVIYSLQISEQVSIVNLLGSAVNIAGILFISSFSSGNIVYVALIYGLSTLLPVVINNIRIFKKNPFLRPKPRLFDKSKVKQLVSLGIIFFILQIGGLVLSFTDNILISNLYGSVEVTPIDIANKLIGIVKGFYVALIIPVWSRTAKALAESDHVWLNKMYKQMAMFLFIFAIGIVLICLLIHPICIIWLGRDVSFGDGIVLIIAIGIFAEMINTSYSSMLNGLGLIKIQMVIAILQTIINFPLSLFLAQTIGLGVMGIKLATTILFLLSGGIYIFYTRRSIEKLRNKHPKEFNI